MATPFPKQYHSPEELALLLQRRGLQFNYTDLVVEQLRRVGYYRLSAYLYPFLAMPKEDKRFKSGSKIRHVIELYEFDQSLRTFVFNEISKVEVAIRSALANIITQETDNVFWITDASMYASEEQFYKIITLVNNKLNLCGDDSLEHTRQEFGNSYPPAWVLVERLPLGALNLIYGNLADNKLRKKVAAEFFLPVPVFSSWFTVLALTRNACCHQARMWNKENAIPPIEPKRMKLPWISLTVSTKKIFYNLCIIKYFINIIDKDNGMTNYLVRLLSHYPHVDTAAMGLPTNWDQEPLWKKQR